MEARCQKHRLAFSGFLARYVRIKPCAACSRKTPESYTQLTPDDWEKGGTGTLTAEISPLDIWTGGGERVCSYSDYQRFGEYMVARSYECDEDRHPKTEARMVELATDPVEDPEIFVPPERAKESVNCLGPIKPPTVVHHEDPKIPRSFRKAKTNIVVAMSVVVGTDGKPHDLRVTSAPNRDYDQAALAAMQHWRFKPTTCDGEPMENEIAVESWFHRF